MSRGVLERGFGRDLAPNLLPARLPAVVTRILWALRRGVREPVPITRKGSLRLQGLHATTDTRTPLLPVISPRLLFQRARHDGGTVCAADQTGKRTDRQ